jgi:uncharacterized protein YdeI (YjbR/CyaY-like superfamily)
VRSSTKLVRRLRKISNGDARFFYIMVRSFATSPPLKRIAALASGARRLARYSSRITNLTDLPSDNQLVGYIRKAAALIDNGQGDNRLIVARRVVKAPKPSLETPAEFTAALKKSKAASTEFAAFSPSCKRDYVEWIAEAKRLETRERRIKQAIEWIAEGKQRNWRYQNC